VWHCCHLLLRGSAYKLRGILCENEGKGRPVTLKAAAHTSSSSPQPSSPPVPQSALTGHWSCR
jgi:hypothetical protein